MHRFTYLLAGLAVFGVLAGHARAAEARPNMVLFLADDQRPGMIHALGNDLISTPNIDSLVAGGTAFRNGHIMGGSQGAVCVPSRAMLLTGLSMFRLEKTGTIIPPTQKTFPELLRSTGYFTFQCGKWHQDRPSFVRSFDLADQTYFGGMSDHTKVKINAWDPTGKFAPADAKIGPKFSTELFADAAVKFVREYKQEKPFYLHLAFTVPHDPRMVPPGFEGKYDASAIKLPANFLPQHPFNNGEMKIRDEALSGWPRDPAYVRSELATYHAMVSHMDQQIGRVLTALKETGRLDNTVIVFGSDNGLALGSHGLLGKQNVYEHSVGVPMIVKGPGLQAGVRSDALVYLLDLCPTFLELAGVQPPADIEGRSLLPILKGQKPAVRDGLLFGYRDFQRGYRDGRWKLCEYNVAGKRTTQLFDLQSDPDETKDLANDPAHAAQLKSLRAAMIEAQRRTGDPQLGKWAGLERAD